MKSLSVENELTIYTAEQQRKRFVEFLASGDELEMSLAKVDEIDTAGLQLLILLKHEAAQANKSLQFVMHSSAVLDVLELINLTSVFGDPLLLVGSEGDRV